MTNGGSAGGGGGQALFADTSDGGDRARDHRGQWQLDISALTSAGMGIGSIEGAGHYFLGRNC